MDQQKHLGLVTTTMFEDIDAGHVGAIVPGVQVKLIDVPEMKFYSYLRDKMESKSSMIGYYKNEEKTREAIDSEGFVHSGDIGVWTESEHIGLQPYERFIQDLIDQRI
ncbi:Long chain acyl-CoA synthetase 7, peroxisomal [Schistosoma japonicum]|uniref:Long chain acyl-CoA synthetase 7, peroxisomal n=1 Tax=Schistosoma japonicum TaxID=6182 RepID=A0A4Z2CS76_SCHJA|nr:Long chain acyl-CoA synthetase 7, peroxisomal [Schistosoma japonicum]